ncbi:MAG: endonuclease [Bacteroidetes bacterium]|nr:endonuclease [Bacteroidota bacterium]
MNMMRISVGILLLCVLHFTASADYLVVSRKATIKEAPEKKGKVFERVSKGDIVVLLDDGVQQNGYYHVTAPKADRAGWMYRTLVRRYEGEIPGFEPAVGNATTELEWESQMPSDYYNAAIGLSGDALKATLNDIIDGHQEFTYTSTAVDVWDILKETDRAIGDPSGVKLLYTDRVRDADAEYNNGSGWTREHVWAKSHGDFGTTRGAGTDVHHLRPVDASVNSTRNNKDFDNGGTEYIDGDFATGCLRDVDSWEPKDSEKGDVARMLFYMAVRYEGENEEPDLELSDQVNTAPTPYHGKLSTLLEWHDLDPVDNWERRRNDIIYLDFQHNRNPFIDHPEYVQMIWGN